MKERKGDYAELIEKVAVANLREHPRTLRRLRHWQRRIWKAREEQRTNRKAA